MMDDQDAALAVLGDATLLGDDTPQSEALGEAVVEHIATRAAPPDRPTSADPAVLAAFDTLAAAAAAEGATS